MKKFVYTARNQNGAISTGMAEAENMKALKNRLRDMGLFVTNVREKTEYIGEEKAVLRYNELIAFCRLLATMLNSGVSLVNALQALEEQTSNEQSKNIFRQLRREINNGSTFTDALANQNDVFPEFLIGMVRIGETGGFLSDILLKVASYLQKEASLKNKIWTAMLYPVFMLAVTAVVTIVLLAFIFPKFTKLYSMYQTNLPFITKVVMGLSTFMRDDWYLLLAAVLVCFIIYIFVRKEEWWLERVDNLKLSFPIFGTLAKYVNLSRLAHTLGLLLSSGVPIVTALQTTRQVVDNRILARMVDDTLDSIMDGGKIAQTFKKSNVFSPVVIQMITAGEESGSLDELLMKISDFYDEEVDALTKKITSLAEPVLIFVVGIIIGSIVVSMYLPVFKIIRVIRGH